MKKLIFTLIVSAILINVSIAQTDTTSTKPGNPKNEVSAKNNNIDTSNWKAQIDLKIKNLQDGLKDFQARIEEKQNQINIWTDSIKVLSSRITEEDSIEKIKILVDSLQNLVDQNQEIIDALNEGIENINKTINDIRDTSHVDTIAIKPPDDAFTIIIPKHKNKEKFKGHWDGIQLGLNGLYFPNSNCVNIPSYCEQSLYCEKLIKSWELSVNPIQFSIPFFNRYVGAVTGLGLTWNNYELSNNQAKMIEPVNGINIALDSNTYYAKNRFKTLSLNLPLIIEFQIRTDSVDNRFYISAGIIGNYNFASKMKYVYYQQALTIKTKDKQTNFHLNEFSYTLTGRVGYEDWYFYANYSPLSLFDKDVIECNKISIGIGRRF